MRAYIYDGNKEPPVKDEIWFKAPLGLSDLWFLSKGLSFYKLIFFPDVQGVTNAQVSQLTSKEGIVHESTKMMISLAKETHKTKGKR